MKLFVITAAAVVATTTAAPSPTPATPCDTPCFNGLSARTMFEDWPEPNSITYEFLAARGCAVEGCIDTTTAPTAEVAGCAACGSSEEPDTDNCSEDEIANCFEGCSYTLIEVGVERAGFEKYLGNFSTVEECADALRGVEATEDNGALLAVDPAVTFGFGDKAGECWGASVFAYDECEFILDDDVMATSGDGNCDEDLNTAQCGYDGGDCCESTCGEANDADCSESAFNCVSEDYLAPYLQSDDTDLFRVDLCLMDVDGECSNICSTAVTSNTPPETTTTESTTTTTTTTSTACYFPGESESCANSVRDCDEADDYCGSNGKIDVETQAECWAAAQDLGASLYQFNSNGNCKYVIDFADCDAEEEVNTVAQDTQIRVVDSVDGLDIPCLTPTNCYYPGVGVSCPSTTRLCELGSTTYCNDEGRIEVTNQNECYLAAVELGAGVFQYNSESSNCKFSLDAADCDEQSETNEITSNTQIYDPESVDGLSAPCMVPDAE